MSAASKPKGLKPRKMWLYTLGDTGTPAEPWSVSQAEAAYTAPAWRDIPVLVIPLTAETHQALILKAAIRMQREGSFGQSWLGLSKQSQTYYLDLAAFAMEGIGIKAPSVKQPTTRRGK